MAAENPHKPQIFDVHTRHCCIKHGCKYGDDEKCTVVTKRAPQEGPCEICGMFEVEERLDDEYDAMKYRLIELEEIGENDDGSLYWSATGEKLQKEIGFGG